MIGKLHILLEKGNYENYYGEIKHDKANGFGKSLNNRGESYIGNFINNKRDGQGTSTKTEFFGIETYSGQWKDNERHGHGKYCDDYGSYSGEWKNGNQHGMGREYYSPEKYENGGVYVGEWVSGFWKGLGIWTENGTSYKGLWYNNTKDGLFVITDSNGKSFNQEYSKGNLVKK